MADSLWWFLDILVVTIIVAAAYLGSRRGFFGTLLTTLGCIVTMVLAVVAGEALCDDFYDAYFSEGLREKAKQSVESYSAGDEVTLALESQYDGITLSNDEVDAALSNPATMSTEINRLVCESTGRDYSTEETDEQLHLAFITTFGNKLKEKLPSFYVTKLSNETDGDSSKLTETIGRVLSSGSDSAAEHLETNFIRPVMLTVIKSIMTIVFFIVGTLLVKLIVAFIMKILMPSPLKVLDKIAGTALGFATGVLIVFIIGLAVRSAVTLSDNDLIFLNDSTIDKTLLFRHFLR